MKDPIGIIAGAGSLPWELAEKLSKNRYPCSVAAMKGFAQIPANCEVPYGVFSMGKVGGILDFFRDQKCKTLVFLGPVKRVPIQSLAVDKLGRSMLLRLGSAWLKGDDGLLRSIINLVEQEGFRVLGAHEVLSELNASAEITGVSFSQLTKTQKSDITLGFHFLDSVSSYDIGQACVVCEGRVLALEGPEGTDEMLKRAVQFADSAYKGVLIKTAKTGQDLRVDMPTIGPKTVQLAAELGYAGIAVEEGKVLFAHSEELEATLHSTGCFLYVRKLDKET